MPIAVQGALAPGLADPVLDGQASFRAILQAMSRPGTLVDLPIAVPVPAPLSASAAAVTLSLVDVDTPLWLDLAAAGAADYLRFHCGCPLVADPAQAAFALIVDPTSMPRLSAFAPGSDDYPDRSTTLILQVATFAQCGWRLSGPGIATTVDFGAAPLPADFAAQWQDNHACYPRGVDVIFAGPGSVAALPRSSTLED